MAFNFPNTPSEGTIFTDTTSGAQYIYTNAVWMQTSAAQINLGAQARSRVVNGAMQISQENGNAVGSTNGYYSADQWKVTFGSTGTLFIQRVQVGTPNGSKDRVRVAVNAADTSIAAGEVLLLEQPIEGLRVADFGYGGPAARQSVLRFGFRGAAGTYAIALGNITADRAYVQTFTIAAGQANTDTVQTFVIPGDTTGGWAADTSVGIMLRLTLMCGTNFHGTTGWSATGAIGTAAVSNFMATAGNIAELFDVGLYLDPQATGVAPPWQMPDQAQELIACQRYYSGKHANMITSGIATAASQGAYSDTFFPASMRIVPAVSATNFLNSNTGGATNSVTTATHLRMNATSSAAGAFFSQYDIVLNARM